MTAATFNGFTLDVLDSCLAQLVCGSAQTVKVKDDIFFYHLSHNRVSNTLNINNITSYCRRQYQAALKQCGGFEKVPFVVFVSSGT